MANGYDLVQVKNIDSTSINYNCLEKGDVIYGVENQNIDFVNDIYFAKIISDHLEENYENYEGDIITSGNQDFEEDGKIYYLVQTPINFKVERDGKKKLVEGYVNTIYNEKGEYVGWTLLSNNEENSSFGLQTYKYSFIEALEEAVPFTFKWAWKVLVVFGQLITGQLSITTLGGPVTTVKMMADFTQNNMLLVLLPLIAVNLAVFNLLPIPALDGFQMIFVAVEWIRKKPVKREVVNAINNIGLILLFGFVIVVDILQFIL